jgi:hypothetical protein
VCACVSQVPPCQAPQRAACMHASAAACSRRPAVHDRQLPCRAAAAARLPVCTCAHRRRCRTRWRRWTPTCWRPRPRTGCTRYWASARSRSTWP